MENDGGSIRSFGRTRFNSIREFYTLGCKIGVIMDDLFLFLSLFQVAGRVCSNRVEFRSKKD